MKRCVFVVFVLITLMASRFAPPVSAQSGFIYSSPQAEKIIAVRARGVVTALRDRHLNRLADFVHPTKGLRFSPYAHATAHDRKFSRAQVRQLGRSTPRYNWGSYDGSGDPIRLTWREYFFKFIYSRDFAAVKKVNYNIIQQRGNTLNNLRAFYPGSIIVEYYTPDLKEKNGSDWQSLCLIFQPRGHTWHLTGIAHDQWTI